jgi:hypothetical protein
LFSQTIAFTKKYAEQSTVRTISLCCACWFPSSTAITLWFNLAICRRIICTWNWELAGAAERDGSHSALFCVLFGEGDGLAEQVFLISGGLIKSPLEHKSVVWHGKSMCFLTFVIWIHFQWL